jgi:hypothetical protein
MQVERGKTRPNTMMTGHTGYITHARKIIMPPAQETLQIPIQEETLIQDEFQQNDLLKDLVDSQDVNVEEMAEEESA